MKPGLILFKLHIPYFMNYKKMWAEKESDCLVNLPRAYEEPLKWEIF